MAIGNQRDEIIEQLHILNQAVKRQNSIWHIFLRGIIYGLGLFIGSAIIATILFGLIAPHFGNINWIRAPFERGSAIRAN